MTRERFLTSADVEQYAAEWGFNIPVDEVVDSWQETTSEWHDALAPLADFAVKPAGGRDYWHPTAADDPRAAYVTRTEVAGRDGGPLTGLKVAVKDNIAVAGMPMTCGSQSLAEYHPTVDATVVRRLLRAGADIVGKTTMSEFALGGSEEAMRFRRPGHPRDPERYPGGSSSGSAIAVAEGSADIALGTDTAASVRCPAAFCGVVGLKPTSALVSQYGLLGFAPSLDTVGTLSRSVETGAIALESIAGADDADPRTSGRRAGEYVRAAMDGASAPEASFAVGVPEPVNASPDVAAVFESALAALSDAGAEITRVSIPAREYALPAWLAIASLEFRAYFRALGNDWALDALADAITSEGEFPSNPVSEFLLCAEHLHRTTGGQYAPLARRAQARVREGIDQMFEGVDVLAMPTMPTVAPLWEDRNSDRENGGFLRAVANTAPFTLSDHPAISVPCGDVSDLPVGLQFVGPRFGEELVIRIAACFETLLDPE